MLENHVLKNHENKKGFLEVTVSFVSEIISCVKDKDNKILITEYNFSNDYS